MICNKCGKSFESGLARSVNVSRNPELKQQILDGTFFLSACPYCGQVNLDDGEFLYNDPSERVLIVMSKIAMSSPGLEGYTCRRVCSVGEMIEKIKIFDAGLSDVAIEICKFVTMQELGRDVSLKFYKMEGTDGELTFAYPEKGQMQMLEIGQNVYADALGILSRNPELENEAGGLVKIDQEWLSRFFR